MQFKTLKHKTLPDTFGVIMEYNEGPEYAHGGIPKLMSLNATIGTLREYHIKTGYPKLADQLDDYELVTYTLTPAITGLEVAKALFDIHHHMVIDEHNMNTVIVYREDELLPLLRQWGIPNPNWEGNAKQFANE